VKGYTRDLGDGIVEMVDEQSKVIGFAIFNFSKRDWKSALTSFKAAVSNSSVSQP
jgi:uncharacterized protein YuzE